MHPQAKSNKKDEMQKDEKLVEKGDSWHMISRAACDENPICHTELRSFIGYESFRRPSAPQAKVNTNRGEKATRHHYAQNYRLASLSEHEGMTETPLRLSVQLSLSALDTVLWPDSNR